MKVKKIVSPWRYPESSERGLHRALDEAVSKSVKILDRRLKQVKFDAEDDEDDDSLEDEIIAIFLAIALTLRKRARTIYLFNSQQFLLMALSSGGERNPAVMDLNLNGAKEAESWYAAKRDSWQDQAQNSLVKMARDIVADWRTNVTTQILKDATSQEATEVIRGRYAIYGSWSKNRATGIIGTFNSMLMRQRLKDAGVSKYIWRGKMDARERASHVALEGKIRVFSAFPFPGEEYGCRCWAVPDWESAE